jgi:hypothetical protein
VSNSSFCPTVTRSVAITAAAMVAVFLAYDWGKSVGRQDYARQVRLEECVNQRYRQMDELRAQATDFIFEAAARRPEPKIDLNKREEIDRVINGMKAQGNREAFYAEHCKQLIDSGVTDFELSGPELEAEMKKLFVEQLKQAMRDVALPKKP